MTTGQKIKKYRKAKGLTQKELGKLCGFSESTADVRIRQYENSDKVPREDLLNTIASVLDVDIVSLQGFTINSEAMAKEVLNDLIAEYGYEFIRSYLVCHKNNENNFTDSKPKTFSPLFENNNCIGCCRKNKITCARNLEH